jgi:hypothetical protein
LELRGEQIVNLCVGRPVPHLSQEVSTVVAENGPPERWLNYVGNDDEGTGCQGSETRNQPFDLWQSILKLIREVAAEEACRYSTPNHDNGSHVRILRVIIGVLMYKKGRAQES